jgi:hypothetical protein
MSKEYWVRIPLAGIIAVNVEAENEEEAEKNNVELDELDQYEEIVSGNVLHAPLNEVEIDEA